MIKSLSQSLETTVVIGIALVFFYIVCFSCLKEVNSLLYEILSLLFGCKLILINTIFYELIGQSFIHWI